MGFIKKLLPELILKLVRPAYHGALALAASVYYGNPSQKMIVIGVTGTAGKSTTSAMLAHILNNTNLKTGYITTINFFDGKTDFINKHGLSMPGGPKLQQSLAQMARNGCRYAIVECTSEGLAQNRHLGINFSGALFTNLSTAHLEAHGSFEQYKQAKLKLFQSVSENKLSVSLIGVNVDSIYADYFLSFNAKQKFGVSLQNKISPLVNTSYQAKVNFSGFELNNQEFSVQLPGEFNKYNALLAAACANMLGVELAAAAAALKTFTAIRGRMEPVENNKGIEIYVDYGCEPASIRAALKAANEISHARLIHVTGTTGGHRDISKRFDFGRASAEMANISIFTNDDVYNSNPDEVIANMETGFNSVAMEKRKATELYKIPDRRAAINKALIIAKPKDLVLITGKGSEQFLILPGNKRILWDEVVVVKEALTKIASANIN